MSTRYTTMTSKRMLKGYPFGVEYLGMLLNTTRIQSLGRSREKCLSIGVETLMARDGNVRDALDRDTMLPVREPRSLVPHQHDNRLYVFVRAAESATRCRKHDLDTTCTAQYHADVVQGRKMSDRLFRMSLNRIELAMRHVCTLHGWIYGQDIVVFRPRDAGVSSLAGYDVAIRPHLLHLHPETDVLSVVELALLHVMYGIRYALEHETPASWTWDLDRDKEARERLIGAARRIDDSVQRVVSPAHPRHEDTASWPLYRDCTARHEVTALRCSPCVVVCAADDDATTGWPAALPRDGKSPFYVSFSRRALPWTPTASTVRLRHSVRLRISNRDVLCAADVLSASVRITSCMYVSDVVRVRRRAGLHHGPMMIDVAVNVPVAQHEWADMMMAIFGPFMHWYNAEQHRQEDVSSSSLAYPPYKQWTQWWWMLCSPSVMHARGLLGRVIDMALSFDATNDDVDDPPPARPPHPIQILRKMYAVLEIAREYERENDPSYKEQDDPWIIHGVHDALCSIDEVALPSSE